MHRCICTRAPCNFTLSILSFSQQIPGTLNTVAHNGNDSVMKTMDGGRVTPNPSRKLDTPLEIVTLYFANASPCYAYV